MREGKSKYMRKNFGEEKSRTRRRAPGNKVFLDQFQIMVRVVLDSDCNHRAARLGVVLGHLTQKMYMYTMYMFRPVARHMLADEFT